MTTDNEQMTQEEKDDLAAMRAIANAKKKEILEKQSAEKEESVEEPVVEEETVVNTDEEDEINDFTPNSDAVMYIEDEVDEDEADEEDDTSLDTPPALEDMVKAFHKIPNADARRELASALNKDIDEYQKKLIINNGFTTEEASRAAWNRMKNLSEERTVKYLEENPNLGVLTINKSQEAELNLTDEERAKLSRSTALHLVVVEDEEIATLIGEAIPSKEKASFLDEVLGALSKYGLPMPMYGDFITFRGAKTAQLASIINSGDMTTNEIINMQASLVYDRMLGGTMMKKKDESGNTVMSYEEFINNFPYYDLDMAVYAVLCASTEETLQLPLHCPNCNKEAEYPIMVKTILDMSDQNVPEVFKARINEILGSRNDPVKMGPLRNNWNKSLRVKSTSNKYIYTLQCPSIAKQMTVIRLAEQAREGVALVYSTVLAWVREIYILDYESGKYVKVTDDPDELQNLITIVAELPEAEFDVLVQLIADKIFVPTFTANMTCKACGKSYPVQFDINELVFHRVRATREVTM